MTLSYQQNKKHIYNWRFENNERVKEITKKSMRKHRAWKAIQKLFLNILLE